MLRGFGTATNATLKELLASDTDQAEDPGADGDDVDAMEGGATLSMPLSMPKSRNVYRNAAKKSMKLKWSSR